MPAFIHTQADESRWQKAKEAARKSAKEGSDSYWALSNYIYHKMGKTEEDVQKAEEYKELMKSLFISASSGLSASEKGTSVPNPAKVGSTSVKMPKSKKLPGANAKPSVFFKSEIEEFRNVKHPTLMKLLDFIRKKHRI